MPEVSAPELIKVYVLEAGDEGSSEGVEAQGVRRTLEAAQVLAQECAEGNEVELAPWEHQEGQPSWWSHAVDDNEYTFVITEFDLPE